MSEYFSTEKTELFVTALTRIEGINMGVIVLVDADEKREVGIPCDNEHLKALLQRRDSPWKTRHRLPEVMWVMLSEFACGNNYYIYINNVEDGQYTALMVEPVRNCARPIDVCDAVLLNVIAQVPIYIKSDMMRLQSSPYEKLSKSSVPLPVNILTKEMLEKSLDRVVDDEDYESAQYLRDEINKRTVRVNKKLYDYPNPTPLMDTPEFKYFKAGDQYNIDLDINSEYRRERINSKRKSENAGRPGDSHSSDRSDGDDGLPFDGMDTDDIIE